MVVQPHLEEAARLAAEVGRQADQAFLVARGQGTAVNWRGAIYYQSASGKLARLNGVAAIFEFDVDKDGKTTAKSWEWK